MATKNNPGEWDCYANADPDEPMFILLGRDPDAPTLVERWAMVRQRNGEDLEKVQDARACADHMRRWLESLGKRERRPREIDVMDGIDIAHVMRHAAENIQRLRRDNQRLHELDNRTERLLQMFEGGPSHGGVEGGEEDVVPKLLKLAADLDVK